MLHVAMGTMQMQDKDLRYLDIFLNVEDKLALSKVGLHNLSRCSHSNGWIQWPLQIAEGDTYAMKNKVIGGQVRILCTICEYDIGQPYTKQQKQTKMVNVPR